MTSHPHSFTRLLVILIVSSSISTVADAQRALADVRSFGDFLDARSVSIDPRGDIYVADAGSHTVYKFSPEGTLMAERGGYGWGNLEFDQCYDVCAANGLDVFVADYGNHRIQRFNRRLEYIGTLYTRDAAEETHRFGYPTGTAVTRFGDLLVIDGENKRLIKFATFNRVERIIGGIDAGGGRLVDPIQVEVGEKDNIYVLERRRIVVFDLFGNYLRSLGTAVLKAASGFAVLDSSIFVADGDRIVELDSAGRLVDIILASEFIPSETAPTYGRGCVDIAVNEQNLIVLFPQTAAILPRESRGRESH